MRPYLLIGALLLWLRGDVMCSSAENKQKCSSLNPHTVDTGSGAPNYVELSMDGEDGQCVLYRVYLATYTNDMTRREFCIFSASAIANGYRLNVLGTMRQASFSKIRLLDKTWALLDFLQEIPEHPRNIVLFVDAFDVLFNSGPKALLKKFLRTDRRILFAAEKGCCSARETVSRGDMACDTEWPDPDMPTIAPFLNSGAFIGFVSELRVLLAAARKEHDDYLPVVQAQGLRNPYAYGTDQLLYCQLFAHSQDDSGALLRKQLKFGLDYQSQVFLCMYLVEVNDGLKFTSSGKAVASPTGLCHQQWAGLCQQALNAKNLSYPVVLHFNGNKEKSQFEVVAKRIQWPSTIPQGELWTSMFLDVERKELVQLRDTCEKHTPSLACATSVGECLSRGSYWGSTPDSVQ